MIEMVNTKDECFMKKRGSCRCLMDMTNCGEKCPFRKTEEEQRAIEAKIVKRLIETNYLGTYKSCIDGATLYSNHE